jgi:hypothetical protein
MALLSSTACNLACQVVFDVIKYILNLQPQFGGLGPLARIGTAEGRHDPHPRPPEPDKIFGSGAILISGFGDPPIGSAQFILTLPRIPTPGGSIGDCSAPEVDPIFSILSQSWKPAHLHICRSVP